MSATAKPSVLVRRMSEAGATLEAILIALEALEAANEKDIERRRKQAERKRKSREVSVTVTPPCGDSHTPKERPPTPPKENTSPSNEGSENESARLFDRFWVAYPKRPNNPKAPAKKAWNKAIKRGADPEEIIRKALLFAKAMALKDPEFIAYAASWLNQERYLDEFTLQTTASNGKSGNIQAMFAALDNLEEQFCGPKPELRLVPSAGGDRARPPPPGLLPDG
jgi:hypothetical protein